MSSPPLDSSANTLVDTITGYISNIQRKELFRKQRLNSIRQYFFQSIGCSILIYFIFQIPILLYLLVKLIFRLTFQIFSIIFWFPLKILQLLLAETNNYAVLFPLFWLFSIIAFLIVKFSKKNIEIYIGKRYKLSKNSSFLFVFIILLLLQTIFILFPLSVSIQEQRKLSLNSLNNKQTITKLSEKEIEYMKNNNNHKQEEYTTFPNRIKPNETIPNKFTLQQQQQHLNSNDEDEHSDLIDHVAESFVTNLLYKVSSDEERLFKQQANNLVDSDQQFTSKVLKKHSTKQIPKTLSRKKSIQEQESIVLYDKFNSWLDETWNIWHQNKPDLQQIYSLSIKHLPRYSVSSIYTAYTDLNCSECTEKNVCHQLAKQKHIDFLNIYRHQSPFPVYLSILKSNGPKCYRHYPNSFCAFRSKISLTHLKQQVYYLIQYCTIISSLIILIIILLYRHRSDKPKKTQEVKLNKPNDIPLQQKTTINIQKNNPLNKKTEKELRIWLEREQHDDYRHIRETYRTELNGLFSKKDKQLQIEALQFNDAKIHNISQISVEPTVINAILSIDHLVFEIINPIQDQHYSIDIRKLTGDLQISLINNIEVKFQQIQIDSSEIIDLKNILSSDEKQLIINILTEILRQTIVQFCFHLSDKQENIIIDTKKTLTTSQPVAIIQKCDTPVKRSIDNNNQSKVPPKEPKKLLVRIVKAVKLHDVEQPFCILELNHPKQIHQTSIAKNGLNPFWDERFLFECNDKSKAIRLQVFDHKKSGRKSNSIFVDTLYADVSIPFSYVTSTIYKQDVQMTPVYPESIIRIEFSTLTEDEALLANNSVDTESLSDRQSWSTIRRETNKIEHNYQRSPSEENSIISVNTDVLLKSGANGYNSHKHSSNTRQATIDIYPTPPDDDTQPIKPRKARSFISSLRHFTFSRRKKHSGKGKQNNNSVISSPNITTETNALSHSISAEPFLYSNTTGPTALGRHRSASRSFRSFFRTSTKKTPINTDNFILDHPDLLSTSPESRKKRSFFRRFKSKQKRPLVHSSANSLTSYDCTRAESVQNTPVRANGNRPVIMSKPLVQ